MKRSSPAVATSTTPGKDERSAMAPAEVSCTQPPLLMKREVTPLGNLSVNLEEASDGNPPGTLERALPPVGEGRDSVDSTVVHSSTEPLNNQTPNQSGAPQPSAKTGCRVSLN